MTHRVAFVTEKAFEDVLKDEGAKIPDVGIIVDSGATGIHSDQIVL
jgi:hypothetical protein